MSVTSKPAIDTTDYILWVLQPVSRTLLKDCQVRTLRYSRRLQNPPCRLQQGVLLFGPHSQPADIYRLLGQQLGRHLSHRDRKFIRRHVPQLPGTRAFALAVQLYLQAKHTDTIPEFLLHHARFARILERFHLPGPQPDCLRWPDPEVAPPTRAQPGILRPWNFS